MSFAAPMFLLAAMAAAIPVVLHLIHRQKAKEVRFSTLRFLRVSVQRTRRRKYVEDGSLLAVRIAILLLIALGLARPAITGLSSLLGGGEAMALALVLDNSASMALMDAGQPRFETARKAAERILARLRDGDQVALLLTGGRLAADLNRLYSSHETVRQALAESRPSLERADLAGKVRQARALLATTSTARKEIYVVTDNQALSWEGLKEDEEKGRAATPGVSGEVPIVLINVARDPAPNVALQSLALDSPAPVAGAPFQAVVQVLNTSTIPQQVHLELHLDGVREGISPTLNLAANSSIQHAFRFALDRSGVHRGEVRLAEEDGLALDNRLFFAIMLDQQVPVAILKPRRTEVANADDAFYLERALAPGGPSGGAIRLRSLTTDSLAGESLSDLAVIYCVNMPALDALSAEKLWKYARGGGHIVWICGPNVRPLAYNAMNALAQGQLLPASLEELREPLPGGVESWRIGSLDKDYPAFERLTEPASLYQSVLVYKHFPMAWGPQSTGRVLARLSDGQPLLVERPLGTGSVLLLGTSAHVDWTNLPVKPLFLPLIARLTYHLADAQFRRTDVIAGAPASFPLTGGPERVGAVEVVRPSGEEVRLDTKDQAPGTFRYADTHEAGIYLIRQLDRNPPKQLAFAVNVDPAESDPAVLANEQVKSRFGSHPLVVCDDPDNLDVILRRFREGVGLGDWFLAAVLVGLVLEVLLANNRGVPSLPTGSPSIVSSRRVEPGVDENDHHTAVSDPPAQVPSSTELRGFLQGLEEAARTSEDV